MVLVRAFLARRPTLTGARRGPRSRPIWPRGCGPRSPVRRRQTPEAFLEGWLRPLTVGVAEEGRPLSGGAVRALGEVALDDPGAAAALGDRGDDERLAAARVAAGEDAVHGGGEQRAPRRCRGRRGRPRAPTAGRRCSGPVKPIATRTRSAGPVNSVPGTGRRSRDEVPVTSRPSTPADAPVLAEDAHDLGAEAALGPGLVERVGRGGAARVLGPRRVRVAAGGRQRRVDVVHHHAGGALAVGRRHAVHARCRRRR